MVKLTDEELLSLMSRGNDLAFSVFFHRYNRPLYLQVYQKLRDEEEAKDIVQDVFVNLWNISQSQGLITGHLKAYLFKAVRNRIFDLLSKKKSADKYVNSLQTFIDRATEQTDYPVREKQMQDLIDKAMLALPHRMRTVFELSRRQHLSHKEIAAQLHISDQTVTDQIKKALRILRVKLGVLFGLMFFLMIY